MGQVQPEPATQQEGQGKKRFFPTWLLCGCWRREPREGGKAKKVSAVAGLMSRAFPEVQSGKPAIRSSSPSRATAKRSSLQGSATHPSGLRPRIVSSPTGGWGSVRSVPFWAAFWNRPKTQARPQPTDQCLLAQVPPKPRPSRAFTFPPNAHSPAPRFSALPLFCPVQSFASRFTPVLTSPRSFSSDPSWAESAPCSRSQTTSSRPQVLRRQTPTPNNPLPSAPKGPTRTRRTSPKLTASTMPISSTPISTMSTSSTLRAVRDRHPDCPPVRAPAVFLAE